MSACCVCVKTVEKQTKKKENVENLSFLHKAYRNRIRNKGEKFCNNISLLSSYLFPSEKNWRKYSEKNDESMKF